VAGRYRFERVIGEGAMGTVIAAHHELLDVPVAVKILSLDLAGKQNFVDRFLREARAVARLKSEHVARVMDVGTLPTGQPFIVMELLEGADLERRLAREKRLPVSEAADFVLQALEAIAHAHSAGIVHRDLKPANLFITLSPDGREVVKVLDFGIAKLVDRQAIDKEGKRSGALTGDHAALGSPSYMSPEQVRDSGSIDHRADLWALGTILYELVTGAPAFDGQSAGEIFGAILHSKPAPLSKLLPDPPPMFEEVIAKCLEPDREKRWGDAAQLARAIAPFGSGAWTDLVARIEHTLARASKPVEPESVRPIPATFGSGERVAPPSDPDLVARRDALARRLLGGKSSGSRMSPVRPSSVPPRSASTPPAPSTTSAPPARPAPERVRTAAAETLTEVPRPAAAHATTPAPAPEPRQAPSASRKLVYAAAIIVAVTGLGVAYAMLHGHGEPASATVTPAVPAAPPTVDPLAAPAETVAAPAAPPATAAALPIEPAPAPAAPGAVGNRTKPVPAKPGAAPAHKPGLPGVLDSPN
jgi:serine/threonine-protein kinase